MEPLRAAGEASAAIGASQAELLAPLLSFIGALVLLSDSQGFTTEEEQTLQNFVSLFLGEFSFVIAPLSVPFTG